MLRWLLSLFRTPCRVAPCGCRSWEHVYLPLEVERCPQHEKEWREWFASRPPELDKKDDDAYWAPFIG